MIIDSLKNAALYYSVNERLGQALKYLATVDFTTLEYGKYEIDGDNIFMMWGEHNLKTKAIAKIEVHNIYADIQLVVEGVESFGWADRRGCNSPVEDFNTDKDIQFFTDTPTTYVALKSGEFVIFLPTDAHAPLVGEGVVRKCIVKIKI